ncbi:class F sortase [Salsipaludibacter albus]|uniref:class F sortase n=1 Tax=Salsipaludibacter albus TaxID=2849650 RepID=UPI001EE40975|nr:class F sortase [Salsipaludibacter albus]MBY5164431.1 class F sortase [Salsipaludibacter albus]
MTSRVLAAIAGVASLVAALLLVLDDGPDDVGEVVLAGPTPAAVSSTPAAASPSPSDDAASTDWSPTAPGAADRSTGATPTAAPTPAVEVGTRSARIGDWQPESVSPPTRLRLPALDLDVAVEHVGVDDDGLMEVPEDVDDAGWYRHGPAPGQAGNIVIAGHVDDREQGLGAFHRLVDLAVGDRVEVEADDGSTSAWEVTGRELVDKSALETSDLFRRSGPTRLVLVTCGGEFDGTVRSYRSNVVVVAQPI